MFLLLFLHLIQSIRENNEINKVRKQKIRDNRLVYDNKRKKARDDPNEYNYSGSCGDDATYSFDENTLHISGFGPINNYTYEDISNWRQFRSLIRNVIIDDGITNIGTYCFCDCGMLASVVIPNSVTHIHYYAFVRCNSIKSINLPNNIEYIGAGAFISCSSLQSIEIPDSVTEIESNCFESCKSLESVKLSNQITKISQYLFYLCTSLKTIKIPDTVTIFERSTFDNCKSLNSIDIPNSVIEFGDRTFYYCESLESIIIPEGITELPVESFYHCIKLKSVIFLGNIKSYYQSAFQFCESLESINITSSIEMMWENVFYGTNPIYLELNNKGYSSWTDIIPLSSIKHLTLGDEMNSLFNENLLNKFTNLETITIAESNPDYTVFDNVVYNKYHSQIIFVPPYITKVKIHDDYSSAITTIFKSKRALTSVVIPDGVTRINEEAFKYCIRLTSVTFGSGLSSIGINAFFECLDLLEFIVPESNNNFTTIDGILFSKNLTNLILYPLNKTAESYEIPNHVLYINYGAFQYCDKLKTVKIGSQVKVIGKAAFFYCSNIESFEIEDGNRIIEDAAFASTNITSIKIGNGTTKVGAEAFEFCTELRSIILGKDITSIGDSAFYLCENLVSIELPEQISIIPRNCFINCYSLKTIIGISVTQIKYNAFYRCFNLTETNFENLQIIEKYAFRYCDSIKSIYISEKINKIEENAFLYCNNVETITVNEKNTVYQSKDNVLFNKNQNELFLYACKKPDKTYTIPDNIKSIASNAFSNLCFLETVIISDNVEEIGYQSFYECYNLKSVTIGSGISNIVPNDFEKCFNIESFQVSENNQQYSSYNGIIYNFYHTNIELVPISIRGSVELHENTTKITKIFNNCQFITSILINDNVTLINDDSFINCTRLSSFVISENNEYYRSLTGIIYDTDYRKILFIPNAISGDVIIHENIKIINKEFQNKDAIESINIPKIIDIYYESFINCTSLKKVTFGSVLETIGSSAFKNCISLESLVIPDGVTEINSNAFYNCTSMKTVEIGRLTQTIDPSSFSKCKSLTSIEVNKYNDYFYSYNHILYNKENKIIIVPPAISGEIKLDPRLTILYDSFSYCDKITSIIFQSTMSYINSGAFIGCTSLQSISFLDESNEYHSTNGILYERDKILHYPAAKTDTSFKVPDGIYFIDKGCFKDCNSLTSITIPDSVSNIKPQAFADCAKLTSIDVSENNKFYSSINGVLYQKTPSRSLHILNKKSNENDSNMINSVLLAYPSGKLDSSFTIPESVNSIQSYAFSGCDNLNYITLNSQITQIKQYSFYNCKMLTSLIYNGLNNPNYEHPILEQCDKFQQVKVTNEYKGDTFCQLQITKEELPDPPGDNDDPTNPSDNENPINPSDNGDISQPSDIENPINPSDNENPANPSDNGDASKPNNDDHDQSNNIDKSENENPSENDNSSHVDDNKPDDNQEDNEKKSKTGIIVGCVIAVIAVIAIIAITVTFYIKKIACFKSRGGNSTSEGGSQIEEI